MDNRRFEACVDMLKSRNFFGEDLSCSGLINLYI